MKVGLVLEGGAMRGMWTCGVLDVLLDNDINVDTIVGTSAGGIFGVNYFSKQRGRAIRYSKRFCKDLRYMSIFSYIFTGNIINKNFAFYKVTKKYDIFDNNTFVNSNKEFYVTATNINTGLAHYFKITDPINQLEELRATSAIPVFSKPVIINNDKYLDGGISDSIPYDKIKDLGCDKIIVVLTQPLEYRKSKIDSKKEKFIRRKYKNYPNLINRMLLRHDEYNSTIEKLISLEKKNEIFVIRPSKKLDINIIERNPSKYDEIYNLGISDCKKSINLLKKYLYK
ncbi:MAG: patatin family protein [Bacilli bacterium]|nr:patatin family protein [Bacilli bacterium]